MESKIIITPLSNTRNGKVIDIAKLRTESYNTDTKVFEVKNIFTSKIRKESLVDISLSNDVILSKGQEFRVLSTFIM